MIFSEVLIEAFCSIMGVIGTILIIKRNKMGYCCYFPSNVLWIYYGIITSQYFFMSQYIFYTGTAIVGFMHWNNLDKKNKKTKEVFNDSEIVA